MARPESDLRWCVGWPTERGGFQLYMVVITVCVHVCWDDCPIFCVLEEEFL